MITEQLHSDFIICKATNLGIGKLIFQIRDFKRYLLSKLPLPVSRTIMPLV